MEGQIGVVVPTLNSAKTLRLTLESLVSQIGVRVEVLVVDSASTDGTLALCRDFGVQMISVPKGNMYRAVNAGLFKLRHEWVTYLNSDDIVRPDAYLRLIQRGEKNVADLAYGDCDYIDGDNKWIGRRYSAPLTLISGLLKGRVMPFAQPSCVFRKALYEKLGGFDERFRFGADLDFVGRAYASGAVFCRVARPVAAFRVHSSQLSIKHKEAAAAEHLLLRYPGLLRSRLPPAGVLWAWRLQNAVPLLQKVARISWQGVVDASRMLQKQ